MPLFGILPLADSGGQHCNAPRLKRVAGGWLTFCAPFINTLVNDMDGLIVG